MSIRRRLAAPLALLALAGLAASPALAVEPGDFPALEWREGPGAYDAVKAMPGVVFVDLYAHY